MRPDDYVERFEDLIGDGFVTALDGGGIDSLRRAVRERDVVALGRFRGHFAVAERCGRAVRMARTIGFPLRYFVAKRFDGPYLVVADRIDRIAAYCRQAGIADQFAPEYTRMVPAHYLVEIRQIGCPDPNPTYERFFTPVRNSLPPDVEEIGRRYVSAAYRVTRDYLARFPGDEPVGVAFSGGVDSTAVAIMARQALAEIGSDVSRLRLFTLALEPEGPDRSQAGDVAQQIGLADQWEVIEADPARLDIRDTVRLIEDYHPLDVQCAAMNDALLAGIRERYPQWRYMLDGDGGDENLKDYPLEGTEITTYSVIDNPLLYHEGWGVDSIKHSLTYSGGLSRAYVRTFMPQRRHGFVGFSPFTVPEVIAVSEGIPFAALTDYEPSRLYALKGEVVAAGMRACFGVDMPVNPKRRFQHGAITARHLESIFPVRKKPYRHVFESLWHEPWPAAPDARAAGAVGAGRRE